MLIGITGSHRTGKTSYLYKLAHEMKLKYNNTSIEIIPEIARESPFPIFSKFNKSTLESQIWMFNTQIKVELEYILRDAIVISDRTVFDYIAYTMEIDKNCAERMLEFVDSFELKYKEIHFLTLDDKKNIDDNLSSMDKELRERIDENLKEILINRKDKYGFSIITKTT